VGQGFCKQKCVMSARIYLIIDTLHVRHMMEVLANWGTSMHEQVM
jgi:hypothetical protein